MPPRVVIMYEITSLVETLYLASGWVLQVSTVPCSTTGPDTLTQLVMSLVQFAISTGLALGILGFAVVGVMHIIGDLEMRRRAKKYFKDIFLGVVILVGAPSFVAYIISAMSVCGGGA